MRWSRYRFRSDVTDCIRTSRYQHRHAYILNNNKLILNLINNK